MSTQTSWKDDTLDEGNSPIVTSKANFQSQFPPIDFPKLSVVKSGSPSKTLADHSALLAVKRLIVLVPNEEVDEAQLSRQIWNLAANYRLDVLLISIVASADESMSALRRLTMLAAMTRASHFKIEKQVVFSTHGDRALRPYWQQTDMILCPAEKNIENLFGNMTPLSQALSDRLKVPVYTFCGLYKYSSRQLPAWQRQLPFWLGFLLIVAISFYFETDVDQIVRGWVGQILLVMVMIIEIGLIYLWTLIAGKNR
jgi:hypothetical protein